MCGLKLAILTNQHNRMPAKANGPECGPTPRAQTSSNNTLILARTLHRARCPAFWLCLRDTDKLKPQVFSLGFLR